MKIIEAFAVKNKCYQAGAPLTPRGIMLHSVGCAQPSAAVFARSFNQYQPGGQSVCVHAFVQADGTVYQTLPWEMRGWHCGGSANSTHIGVEMTEPSAGMTRSEAAEQIAGTYRTVVELFAELCKQYELDPAQDGVIIGHAEGHRRGVASNHADPELLWQQYHTGCTMDGFRRDVAEAMAKEDREEVPDMPRYDSVAEMPQWARADAQRLIDRSADGILGLDRVACGRLVSGHAARLCHRQRCRSARRHMEQPLRPRGTVAQGGQRGGRAGGGAAGLRTAGAARQCAGTGRTL